MFPMSPEVELAPAVGGARSAAAPVTDGAAPVVDVSDLHVTFERGGRHVRAVRGVDLRIGRGEIVGLVGESGSGKSVLGLSLLGLLPIEPPPAVEGRALVCGVDMVSASTDERRRLRRSRLGAIFQDPMTSLNPTMRVGRQVAEAAGTESEAVRLLDAVGVPEPRRRLKSFPHELSGGLRQRVMIAMAVAGSPELVIADEPTTALDVTVQAQILELLRHLCDELGTTFMLITHDLGVAAQVADRIAVLYAGRLAEVGAAASVLESPAHPYTVGLLQSRLTLSARREGPLPTLPGEPPDPRAHPRGCAFGPRCALHEPECDDALPELIPAERHDGWAACRRLGAVAPITNKQLDSWAQALAVPAPAPSVAAANAGTGRAAPSPTAGEGRTAQAPVAAVRLVGIEKRFGIRRGMRSKEVLHALRGVDLEVAEGEAVALVGESGCGKSTLLRTIAGLLTPEAGTVTLGAGGRPQMVFQDAGASLTPWVSVGELVGERLRSEGIGRAERASRVRDALALVGLPAEVASAKSAQLSGGQRQRVAIARATIVPPEVLLCDEPTSALDVSLAATVLNLLGRIRRELGMAMLFVTHDLGAARVVADRIAVMYLGRIVEVGPADEIVGNPQHPYTRALLGAVPGVGVVRSPLQGEPASPLHPPSGCAFHPRCDVALESCSTDAVPAITIGRRTVACVRAGTVIDMTDTIGAASPGAADPTDSVGSVGSVGNTGGASGGRR
jgi:peptide/nickel transport system ATP-binding protein